MRRAFLGSELALADSGHLQDGYVNAILQQPGRPVLQLALMPYEGLSSVTQDVVRTHCYVYTLSAEQQRYRRPIASQTRWQT